MTVVSSYWKDKFMEYVELCEDELNLAMGDSTFKIFSNSRLLLDTLSSYFSHIVANTVRGSSVIYVIEHPGFNLDIPFSSWGNTYDESEKSVSVYDLEDGRLVYQAASRMLFLQSDEFRIALGPCEENPNLVIDFILNQYMNDLLRNNWQVSKAACIEVGGVGIALASEKQIDRSTLLLKLMNFDEARFVTAEDLFLKENDGYLEARGVAKLPHVFTAVVLDIPQLIGLLPSGRRDELLSLSKKEIWSLPESYEVDVEVLYGLEKIVHDTAVQLLVVLDWSLESKNPLTILENNIDDPLVQKVLRNSPGPYFSNVNGRFLSKATVTPLKTDTGEPLQLKVLRVTGQMDYDVLLSELKKYLS